MRLRFLRSPAPAAPGVPGFAAPRRSSLPFFLGRVDWFRVERSILPITFICGPTLGTPRVNTSGSVLLAAGSGFASAAASGFGAGAAGALGAAGASAFTAGAAGFGASAFGVSALGASALGASGFFTSAAGAAGAGAGAAFSTAGVAGFCTGAAGAGAGAAAGAAAFASGAFAAVLAGLPVDRSILPTTLGPLGASAGAVLISSLRGADTVFAFAAWRSTFCCSLCVFRVRSGLYSLTRMSYTSSSILALGLSSTVIPFLRRNSMIVGTATLRSVAALLILVLGM